MRHRRFAFAHLLSAYLTSCDAFSQSLTTTSFERSSTGRFEACSCKPAPGDLLPSSVQHHELALVFVTHAIGCLYVCRVRSPASARRNTFRLVRRNCAAAADRMGVVWSTDFRLAVPVVGVARLNSFLQSAARNCSAL